LNTLYKVASSVGTPLALAGVALAILATVLLHIIKSPKLSQVNAKTSGQLLTYIVIGMFGIAGLTTLLGCAAWGYATYVDHQKQVVRHQNQLDAIRHYSDLVTILRNETGRILSEYPEEYRDLRERGLSEAEAKEQLRVAARSNIDGRCNPDRTRSLVSLAFPAQEWKGFFAGGKRHYGEFFDAVNAAVASGTFAEKKEMLALLRREYLHHHEQRIEELRTLTGGALHGEIVAASDRQ
jgi:hypothetical protein